MVDSTRSTRKSNGGGNGPARPQIKIVVPEDHSMVGLLGFRDELLHVIERAFRSSDIHARDNEITVTGPEPEIALVAKLFGELIKLLSSGAELSPDSVERT